MKNYYRILGIKPTATDDDVKRSYRTLAKKYHPDVNPDSASAAQRFADINEANAVLSDPQKRAEYDASLRAATQAQQAQAATRRTAKTAGSPLFGNGGTFAQMQAQYQTQMQAQMQAQILAQLQAQVQAQVQTQVQAQLNSVRDMAYRAGYTQGSKDGQAFGRKSAATETEQVKKKANEYARDRNDLEQELFDRDRQLAQANDRIADLETRLQWFRNTTRSETDQTAELLQAQLTETQSRVQKLQAELGNLDIPKVSVDGSTSLLHDKANDLKDALNVLRKRTELAAADVAELDAVAKRQRQAAEALRDVTDIETRAEAWAKKQQSDKRLAKPTLYGTLGVLIWATDEEIENAYQKMKVRLTGKQTDDTPEALQRLEAAYAVLSDAKRRAEYNTSIGFSDARIASERRLIAENERVQNEYRDRLAARSFWARFDELSALALGDDAEAQNALGELYYDGKFFDPDYTQAFYWFREAFNHKFPLAIANMGKCYYYGRGVTRNRSIAKALFRQAQNLGVPTPPLGE